MFRHETTRPGALVQLQNREPRVGDLGQALLAHRIFDLGREVWVVPAAIGADDFFMHSIQHPQEHVSLSPASRIEARQGAA